MRRHAAAAVAAATVTPVHADHVSRKCQKKCDAALPNYVTWWEAKGKR